MVVDNSIEIDSMSQHNSSKTGRMRGPPSTPVHSNRNKNPDNRTRNKPGFNSLGVGSSSINIVSSGGFRMYLTKLQKRNLRKKKKNQSSRSEQNYYDL